MENSIFIGRKVSDETRQWLQENEIVFEEHPLIQIEFIKPDFLDCFDNQNQHKQFVITSQWAARWLVNNLVEVGLKKDDTILCISEKQKAICKAVSRKIFVSSRQNAQSLVELVLEKNIPAMVVFLRGNQSLNIIESQLSTYRHGFRAIEVYYNLPVLIKLHNEFCAYIFFSPGSAENFYNNGNMISDTSKIIAIGETTAKKCSALFKNRVSFSGNQEELSVVKYAVELLRQTEFQS